MLNDIEQTSIQFDEELDKMTPAYREQVLYVKKQLEAIVEANGEAGFCALCLVAREQYEKIKQTFQQ